MNSHKYDLYIHEVNGFVSLTAAQKQFVIDVASGKVIGEMGSTRSAIAKKLRTAMNVPKEMKFVQMACKFVYKHSLLPLYD